MVNTDLITTSYSAAANRNNINDLGDCFAMGNFDGRATDNQFIVLKSRYQNVSIFEMFDEDGKFAMNYVFRHTDRNPGQGDAQAMAGHMPLVADLDGDGIDELVSSYNVFKVRTGEDGKAVRRAADVTTGNAGQPAVEPWWWINSNVVMRSGNPDMPGAEKNDNTRARNSSGGLVTSNDHCDTIQVGYVLGDDGPLCIVFGGGGEGTSTFCYTYDGTFLWTNGVAKEPQSLNLAQFRTDAKGLTVYGLDRRDRGSTNPYDGMFLIDGYGGKTLVLEPDNYGGYGTIVIRIDNWTGTYAPLCASFFRGGGQMPALYDGYFNKLLNLADNDGQRFMAMDLCGDARTELVAYNDSGLIIIYYNNANGDVKTEADKLAALRSGITGVPKPQSYFMANYSRYPTDVYFDDMGSRIPAQPQAKNVPANSAFIDWTPIITADSYTLYKNGVKVGTFKDVGYQDNNLIPNIANVYYVVAHEKGADSQASLPLVVSTSANTVTFMDGDTVYATRNTAPGLSLGALFPAAPSKAGFIFLGWFNGDVQFTAESIVTDDLTVFAKWEAVATLTGISYSGFTSLTVGHSANIPVSVTSINADGQSIIVGLFAGGVEIASITLANGAGVIKAPAIGSANVEIRAKLAGGDWAVSKTIPTKALPTDIWAPVVDVRSPAGKTDVDFADSITLTDKAAATINGVPAAVSASGATLVIDAASEAGDVIVMKGVKYPTLFPSYSFTFTVTRGADYVHDWSVVISDNFTSAVNTTFSFVNSPNYGRIVNTGGGMTPNFGTYFGRTAFNMVSSGTGMRSYRARFNQTITPGTEGLIKMSFQWRPGSPERPANNGLLSIDPVSTFASGLTEFPVGLLSFVISDGLYYRTDPYTSANPTGMTGTLLKSNLNEWYNIEIIFDFVNKKINLSVAADSLDPDEVIATIDFHSSMLTATQIGSLSFGCARTSSGDATMNTSIANLEISVK